MINAELTRLFEQIKLLEPNIQAFLGKGLSDEEITKLEREHGVLLPQVLRELYKVVNGSFEVDSSGNLARITFPILLLYAMLPLNEALKLRASFLEKDIVACYSANWLPLFDDGNRYLFADLSTKEVRVAEYDPELWYDFNKAIIFPSLQAMFDYVSAILDQNCLTTHDDGRITEDNECSRAIALSMFDLPYWQEEDFGAED